MGELRRKADSDLYELLEVSPRASQKVIQAAYRALVQNSHPDVNATAEAGAKIRRLNAAYRVLGNSERRARYDLECTRARRTKGVLTFDPNAVRAVAAGPGRTLVPMVAAAPVHRIHERRPALVMTPGAVLALIVVATLTAMFLLLIWFGLDPTR